MNPSSAGSGALVVGGPLAPVGRLVFEELFAHRLHDGPVAADVVPFPGIELELDAVLVLPVVVRFSFVPVLVGQVLRRRLPGEEALGDAVVGPEPHALKSCPRPPAVDVLVLFEATDFR